MSAEGGIGKLANYQDVQTDSRVAGVKVVRFGQAVQSNENVAEPFDTGAFFGVAIAKNYVDEITSGDKSGAYKRHEMIPVLRKGTIWVQVDEDVKIGEFAKVNATGNFGLATDRASSVGIYQSTAHQDGLAMLQINLP